MASREVQIANLVYQYAEHIDAREFEAAAMLFAHAKVKTPLGDVGPRELLEMWRNGIRIHADGTPRTKHVITNPIIEVDEEEGRATCRTYYTVLQQAGEGPLQPVICGRYHDAFERVEGVWRFSYRDYSLHDLVGDMSAHSRNHERPANGGQYAVTMNAKSGP